MTDWTLLKKLIWLRRAVGGGAAPVLKTITGSLLHITDALARPANEFVAVLSPKQEGSGDPSPSNVRPISGWTGMNVEHAEFYSAFLPSSLAPGEEMVKSGLHIQYLGNGVFRVYGTTTGTVTSDFINIVPIPIAASTGLKLHFNNTVADQYVYIYVYSGNTNSGTALNHKNAVSTGVDSRFDGKSLDKFTIIMYGGKTVDFTIKLELEKNQETLPITWQSTAGTVYGCSLTIHEDGSGTLVDGYGVVNLAEWTWKENADGTAFWHDSPSNFSTVSTQSEVVHGICDNYKSIAHQDIGRNFYAISQRPSGARIFVKTDGTLDVTPTGTFVYQLETPVTYELTASEVGQLLLYQGENNIWTDASDDLTLTYYADGNVSDLEALNTLLGGAYTPGDVSDRDALNILLGG